MNYFSGEPSWHRQLREMTERTNAWQSMNQNAVNRFQESLSRQAGLVSAGMQIAGMQEGWQKQWQLSNPVLEALPRCQKDIVRQSGIGATVAQLYAVQNSALKRALETAAPLGVMESIGQQYAESVRQLLPTISIQAEFGASVTAKIAEAIREGWVDSEVVDDAVEYVDEESPGFSLAVQGSLDGLVAWDEAMRAEMLLAWKVMLYITQCVVLMWLSGVLEAESPQEALKAVLATLFEGWLGDKVLKPLVKPTNTTA